ncbi:MAG: heme biosynthesis HemY N-terminal domain-containing protein [Halothiobacillus sp.]
MKRLALIVLILGLAVAAGLYFVRDPGTADIALLGWQLQTSALGLLALLFVAFIVLTLIWRIVASVLNIPTFWRQRSARQKRAAADEQLLRAWAELERGRFEVAGKLALTQHAHASVPPLHYVVAADALLARGETLAALNLLDEVRHSFPRFADYLALHLANRFRAQHNLPPAVELLQNLATRHPKDEAIICAFAETLYMAADWDKLRTLMPVLRRLKWPGLAEQDLYRYELGVYRGLMAAMVRAKQPDQLTALWIDVPKTLRTDASLLNAAARAWVQLGQPAQAEQLLEKALNHTCTPELLRHWLAVPPANPVRARALFQGWVNRPNCTVDEPTRAYGRAWLAWLNDDLDGAQQALAPILNDQPDVPSLKLAAEIAQRQRDSVQALALYTQAFNRLALESKEIPPRQGPSDQSLVP